MYGTIITLLEVSNWHLFICAALYKKAN